MDGIDPTTQGAALLTQVVPRCVQTGESTAAIPDDGAFPAECAAMVDAVAPRRSEYFTVRRLAREALGRLGVEPVAILDGPDRAPVWPNGLVGSLTHCTGFHGAAVARQAGVISVGIDAEPNQAVPADALRELSSAEERRHLARLPARDIAWDRLLFSAKEAIYKTWYPLTGRWLGYTDAVVTVDPDERTFRGRLLVPVPPVAGARLDEFAGRWVAGGGVVVTAVTLLRSP